AKGDRRRRNGLERGDATRAPARRPLRLPRSHGCRQQPPAGEPPRPARQEPQALCARQPPRRTGRLPSRWPRLSVRTPRKAPGASSFSLRRASVPSISPASGRSGSACPSGGPYGIVRPFSICRRSSGVEHTLGKGGVACSIHAGGTIEDLKKIKLFLAVDNAVWNVNIPRIERYVGVTVSDVRPL